MNLSNSYTFNLYSLLNNITILFVKKMRLYVVKLNKFDKCLIFGVYDLIELDI
jgi:hypothetical protein